MGIRIQVTDLPESHLLGTYPGDSKPIEMDAWIECQERLPDEARQALVEVRNHFASGQHLFLGSGLTQRIMENHRPG